MPFDSPSSTHPHPTSPITAPASSPPAPPDHDSTPLSTLSVRAVDALNDIHHLFQAYQCLEALLMPRGAQAEELAVPDAQLHTLLAALNEPMAQRIRHAQQAAGLVLRGVQPPPSPLGREHEPAAQPD